MKCTIKIYPVRFKQIDIVRKKINKRTKLFRKDTTINIKYNQF